MANYKEQNISGSAYIRAREVHIANPLDGQRTIVFDEERIMNLDGESVITPCRLERPRTDFTQDNAMTTFNLLDQNGVPTGTTATYMEVYLMLQSLYYHLAQQRDNSLEQA